jgi:hypothetical protein
MRPRRMQKNAIVEKTTRAVTRSATPIAMPTPFEDRDPVSISLKGAASSLFVAGGAGVDIMKFIAGDISLGFDLM